MRKTIFAFVCAVLALCGCQRKAEVPVDGLEFSSEAPQTRTAWNGETLEWSAGDAISMAYTVDGVWAGPALYPSKPLSQGGPTAHFSVPGNFSAAGEGVYRFYAIHPALATTAFNDAPDVTATVPRIQTPATDTFDPAADLMAGISVQEYRSLPTSAVPLKWTRLTAHGDITLKNLVLEAGEAVTNIILQAQPNADLTGDVVIDLANPQEFSTAGSPLVTVLGDNLYPDDDNNFRFWISVFPTTLTELTVTVETDKATYRKTFKGISKTFGQNARNILGINMADAVKTVKEQFYEKVTNTPEDWTGDYLIVYEEDALVLDSDGSANTHAEVTIQGNKIAYESAKEWNIHIAKSGSGYSMKLGDNYLSLKENKNALNFSTTDDSDNARWTFKLEDKTIRAYNVKFSNRYLQYNSGSHQFRCYTGGQQDVQFFRLNGEASGGGTVPTPVPPTVTTGGSSSVTQTEATLSATFTGTPAYGGFEWGLSADDLEEDWQASYLKNGAFQVSINGLGAGHTYYYRAYIAVLEDATYQYYYGDIKSFTTLSSEIIIGGDQPGWYETPVMNISHSDKYMFNTSDPTQYYAIHMCTGGEKGPGGKTARNYTVCFSAEHHCPVWVAAPRHAMYVGNSGRNDNYRRDPEIPADIQYSSTKTGGGCNKGHMLGSAERTSSKETNRDVFYYTNIAPQLSSNFNTGGGRWNVLEDYVDTQVCADTLYEVLGCYFDEYTDAYGETQTPSKISYCGRNDVSMPTMFYYVLLRTKSGNSKKALKDCTADELKCVAFVRAHVNVRQSVSKKELMSVADLEKITGVTYFPNVPNAPKNTFKASDWDL